MFFTFLFNNLKGLSKLASSYFNITVKYNVSALGILLVLLLL